MRGNKVIIFLMVFLGGFTLVSSLDFDDLSCEAVEERKSEIIGLSIPEKVSFSNEVINAYIGEDAYGNLKINNKIVSDFSCVENENATYKVYVESLETIRAFLDSDDFVGTYKEKTSSGEIKIKGVGFGNKVKLFFVKIFLKFA